MRKLVVGVAAILLAACGLLLAMAPDNFSIIILIVMCLVIAAGFFMGLMPAILFGNGFKMARETIEQTLDVQSMETWIAVFKVENIFRNRDLDKVFKEYKAKIEEEKEYDEIESDISEYISEEFLSLRTWQGLILQIPGVLTGLGILGTFIGLITGISSIGFSSVEAALESITVLLSGIQTAFYTSISGVILSIIFNMVNRIVWNCMLREYGLFTDTYHKIVIPSVEELERTRLHKSLRQIITRLDKLPKDKGFSLSNTGENLGNGTSEQMMMVQIVEGLKQNEFTFYLQPRIELSTKKILAAEALVRWEHPELGLLQPSVFIPLLEKNGFITRLDAYVWEQVFITVRKWIDSGNRPVPISVNLSKTDIMAMDVVGFFGRMLDKYRIPPRALEIEIAKNAYIQNMSSAVEVAGGLRRLGFKVILDGFDGDYISVNMMDNMETDALKLDLRFLPEHDYSGIESIFDQARKLNIEMMAGGIENTEQISHLKRAGCIDGQGFYYFKPMSIKDFEKRTMKME